MFTKQELQVIGQTLAQKRAWITKNINNSELNKAELEQNLQAIESVLQKISTQFKASNGDKNTVNHYISEKSVSPIRQAAFGRRQELAPGQIRVLLVDDDQVICELMAAYLNASGIYLIDFANDGMRGISMMYDANPIYDLVLCDWNMPSKSGIEVHNAMRAAERYLGTVFMLVTAVSEAKQIRSAIEDGVDDYVVKPIEHDKLIKKIARFFPQVQAGEI
ncbi:response regulator [Cellvibrio sp. pealriver]|uniref:response regulator n=1 Tax=Cellvibrio sp. pealriver TaxID=1622269 RepID=UPI00066FE6CD|nr:response regulator [Cellvibrio sp. pealriver]